MWLSGVTVELCSTPAGQRIRHRDRLCTSVLALMGVAWEVIGVRRPRLRRYCLSVRFRQVRLLSKFLILEVMQVRHVHQPTAPEWLESWPLYSLE